MLVREDGGILDQGGLMLVIEFSSIRVLQVVFPVLLKDKDVYFRIFNYTDSVWGSWIKVSTSFIS